MTTDHTAYGDVRAAVEAAIRQVVRGTDGDGGFDQRPIFTGARTTASLPKPLPGLRAALLVADIAGQAAARYATQAHGEGVTWKQLAEPLGVDGADRAYERVLGPDDRTNRFDQRSLWWTCGTCQAGITDHGPADGHPADCETGHADGCSRHAGEVADYERRMDGTDR